jgi:hypothetical protein
MRGIPNNVRLAVTLATLCIHQRHIQAARNLLEDELQGGIHRDAKRV